jgi:hypothetical protein
MILALCPVTSTTFSVPSPFSESERGMAIQQICGLSFFTTPWTSPYFFISSLNKGKKSNMPFFEMFRMCARLKSTGTASKKLWNNLTYF